MITAKEAEKISSESLTDEKKRQLLESVDGMIRLAASQGIRMITVEQRNLTQVENTFIRDEMKKAGFTMSDVGMNIYW